MNATASDKPLATQWILWIAILCAVAWFATLGARKLLNPDESRYAEIAREMAVTGDWLTPRLNGLKYFEKPPLQYWATASAYHVFGLNEFAARFWSALTSVLGILCTYLAGARLFSRTTGIVATAILSSSIMWFALGHLNTLDAGVSGLLTAAVSAFLIAQTTTPSSKEERSWMLIAWAMAALALLSKGLEALVLPALALVIYSFVEREFSAWRRLHVAWGLVVFLTIASPWFVAMSIVNPEFPHFFFIHEHVERFLTDVHERVEPWWYFFPVLALGLVPWLTIAAHGLSTSWQIDAKVSGFRARRFLLIFAASTFAFFSASHSKLQPYILPIFPALALLIADALERMTTTALRRHLSILASFWAIVMCYAAFGPLPHKRGASPEMFATLFDWLTICAGAALAGAVIAWRLVGHNRRRDGIVAMGAATLLGLSALLVGFDALREIRSGYDLSQAIKPRLSPERPIYSVHGYDQSLPFYLGRTMTLVGYRGETDFGLEREPEKGLKTLAEFVDRWRTDPAGSMAIMTHATFDTLRDQGIPMTRLGSNVESVAVIKE